MLAMKVKIFLHYDMSLNKTLFPAELNTAGVRVNIDVTKYFHQLFCLKRDFQLSNLPQPHAIRVINKASTGEKLKVVEINLFDPNGEMTLLELWNDDAVNGVKFLWSVLQNEDEVLLRIQDLDPAEPIRDRRMGAYKFAEPTDFQRKYKAYPVKQRIVAKTTGKDQTCDLSRQCRHIRVNSSIQLMNGGEALRDIGQWYQTVEAQEEDEDPDELQQLILHTLGKRTIVETASSSNKRPEKDMIATNVDTVITPKKNKDRSNKNNNTVSNSAPTVSQEEDIEK